MDARTSILSSRKLYALLSTGILLLLAAQIAFLYLPLLGVYLNVLAFIGLLVLALTVDSLRKVAITLAMLPAITMILVVAPIEGDLLRHATFYTGLLIAAIYYRNVLKHERPFVRMPVFSRNLFKTTIIAMAIGMVLGIVGFFVYSDAFLLKGTSLPLVIVLGVLFAAAEEIYFRGLVQEHTSRSTSPEVAIVFVAILSVCLSIGYESGWIYLFTALSSLLLALIYSYKHNLALTFVINFAMKLTMIVAIAQVFNI